MINPFTLKELRQLTRSRAIAGALVFFLFAFLLATYLMPLRGIACDTGSGLATVLCMLLFPALSLVLPIDIFVKMVKERRRRSADLTLVTPLPPASIVDGKLRSAYALMFLFSAAAMPFGVAAYLLHGVTFVEMLKMLAIVVGYSSVMVHATVAIASLRASAVLRVILFVALVFNVGTTSIVGFILLPTCANAPSGDFVLMLAVMATVCLLLRAQAVSWISPAVMERDLPLRLTALAASVGWIAYCLLANWNGPAATLERSARIAVAHFTVLAGWLGVLAVARPAGYSQRQLCALPASRWRRTATWIFRSGTVNGLAFALLLGTLVAYVLPLVAPHVNGLYALEKRYVNEQCNAFKTMSDPVTPIIIFAYVMAALMYFRAAWYALFRQTRVSPVLVPVAALFALSMYQTVPASIEITGGTAGGFMPFYFGDVSDNCMKHVVVSAAALLLGIAAMLPESIAAFRARR